MGAYNPATGQREFIFISTPQEVQMGNNLHSEILRKYKLSGDREKILRLESIGEALASVSDRQDYEYHFYLIEGSELNAFTGPGGYIYMFTGLYDRLGTDSQIALSLIHI